MRKYNVPRPVDLEVAKGSGMFSVVQLDLPRVHRTEEHNEIR